MNKREKELLERAFGQEVESALNGGAHLIQTRSDIAKKLVDDGLLRESEITLQGKFPVKIKGYELTEAGRLAYCMTC